MNLSTRRRRKENDRSTILLASRPRVLITWPNGERSSSSPADAPHPRSITPILINPLNAWGHGALTPAQFHYAFTSALTRAESDEVYQRLYLPAAGRAFFQGAVANLNPASALKVNFKNHDRAPLLLASGERDMILPPSIQQETLRRYAGSRATTEYKLFEGRSHYIAGEPGWEQVADTLLGWGLAHMRR